MLTLQAIIGKIGELWLAEFFASRGVYVTFRWDNQWCHWDAESPIWGLIQVKTFCGPVAHYNSGNELRHGWKHQYLDQHVFVLDGGIASYMNVGRQLPPVYEPRLWYCKKTAPRLPGESESACNYYVRVADLSVVVEVPGLRSLWGYA